MPRKALAVGLPSLLLAVTASGPHAGGWVVITVEDVPSHLVAGVPYEFTYTVRQHGQTLRDGLDGRVRAASGEEVVEAAARPGERKGEYRAELTVPREGAWTVTIRSEVVPGASDLVMESELFPIEAFGEGEEPRVALSRHERGRRLFVAKGCMTCHVHRSIASSGVVSVGPELTERRYEAAYLAMYLADPTIRPPTNPTTFPMPDLDLDDAEISGLTAFLNAEEW